jgi:tetratricopeptide (TPR) repeat protein
VRSDPGAKEKFFTAADAWKCFPPAGVPGVSPAGRRPAEEQVRTAFESVVSLIGSREVVPRADRMRASFDPGGGSGRQRNALGILYARYGMYREALAEFQAAAALGEKRAEINIGNVAFLTGDYKTAALWYEKAMRELPDRVEPVVGLARAYYELDRYDDADRLFRRAVEMMPDLAVRYGYLSARLPGDSARASAAEARLGNVMWDE